MTTSVHYIDLWEDLRVDNTQHPTLKDFKLLYVLVCSVCIEKLNREARKNENALQHVEESLVECMGGARFLISP